MCVLLLLASASQSQQKPSYKELPNFQKVSDQLYRGAQPIDGGIRKLSELGIKTVINLRGPDELIRGEQSETESAGLRYFNIPMPGLSAPTDEQVARVMSIINDPDNQPVFVHCRTGNRIAALLLIYRVKKQGWFFEAALDEANRLGLTESSIRDAAFKYLGKNT